MEILISANQMILNMVKRDEISVSEDMSKEEFARWNEQLNGDELINENELQEV